MAQHAQMGFQDAASPLMEQLIYFHDHTLSVIIGISIIVLYLIGLTVSTKLTNKHVLDSQLLEVVWTFLPALTLSLIAFPSLFILFFLESVSGPYFMIKVTGFQWYWYYDYLDVDFMKFKSRMLKTSEIQTGSFRLLEVDRRTVLPANVPIRMLICAHDVLHAWTMPALGMKMDAVPGRTNFITFMCTRVGLFFGQCSEVCGANHSFMPIVLEVMPLKLFVQAMMFWSKTH